MQQNNHSPLGRQQEIIIFQNEKGNHDTHRISESQKDLASCFMLVRFELVSSFSIDEDVIGKKDAQHLASVYSSLLTCVFVYRSLSLIKVGTEKK